MKYLGDPSSGSQAGTTASRNRFGQYRRTRAIPVQPRTPKQGNNRSLLTSGSSAWRTLSDVLRTAWNDYAQQISRSDSLGSSYSPTGASLFTGSWIANGGVVSDAPATLPEYVLLITGVNYTDPTPGPEALEIEFAYTSSDSVIVVETSGPISPGVTSSASVRNWRSLPLSAVNLREKQFSMASSPVDVLAEYKTLFPSPAVGNAIWFRFREVWYPSTIGGPITNRLTQTFRLVIA